jgi:hypothetical protein
MSAHTPVPGSARVLRDGECVLALADLSLNFAALNVTMSNASLFRCDAETNTRDARATQNPALYPREVFENQ